MVERGGKPKRQATGNLHVIQTWRQEANLLSARSFNLTFNFADRPLLHKTIIFAEQCLILPLYPKLRRPENRFGFLPQKTASTFCHISCLRFPGIYLQFICSCTGRSEIIVISKNQYFATFSLLCFYRHRRN